MLKDELISKIKKHNFFVPSIVWDKNDNCIDYKFSHFQFHYHENRNSFSDDIRGKLSIGLKDLIDTENNILFNNLKTAKRVFEKHGYIFKKIEAEIFNINYILIEPKIKDFRNFNKFFAILECKHLLIEKIC